MVKEVKNQVVGLKKEEVKKNLKKFELDILNLLKKGLNPSKISVHLNMSMPNLSYYLSSLKKQNLVKKKGYGVWEVTQFGEVKISSHKGGFQVGGMNREKLKKVRGHAFIWKAKPDRKINWKSLLNNKNIKYEKKGISETPRINIKGRKVWLGENYITVFESGSFFERNTIESKKQAIMSFLDIMEEIKSISGEFRYKFTCRRQHYGFIDSKDARHFLRKGKKILIRNEKGYWFSIDHSQNRYKEAETIHEKDADIDGLGYQRMMNSHEKTNFKVTPEFILDAFHKQSKLMKGMERMQRNDRKIMNHLSLNLKTHFEVLEGIKNAIKDLSEEIKKINKKV